MRFAMMHDSLGQDGFDARADRTGKRIVFVSVFIGVFAASTSAAYAYLDPGSVNLMLQAVVGGIAAAAAVVGTYWRKVKGFFSPRSGKTAKDKNDNAPS
jgi:hypothetical protein